jgi:arylformamidase
MEIIDISTEISESMTIYPGNPGVRIKTKRDADGFAVSELRMGSHTGTHIDSPYHVFASGKKADEAVLGKLYGRCRVLDLTNVEGSIEANDIMEFRIRKGEIILLKTRNSLIKGKSFRKDFVYIGKSAARLLAGSGINAVGVDYLSVERFGAKPESHRILLRKIAVFEGLSLNGVRPGSYIFIGFPVKIGIDAAPVRAVLIKGK